MLIVLLILSMFFNVGAQFVLKTGIQRLRLEKIDGPTLLKIASSPYIWLGATAYGLSFIIYIFSLSKGELSKISPVSQALTILGVLLVSTIFFNEPLTIYKILGIIFLMIGVYIIFL